MIITKEMTINDILSISKKTKDVLNSFNMTCHSCPSSLVETLEDACLIHRLDVNEVLKKLNEVICE